MKPSPGGSGLTAADVAAQLEGLTVAELDRIELRIDRILRARDRLASRRNVS